MPGSRFTDLDRPPLDEVALRRALVGAAAGTAPLARLDVVAATGSTNADLLGDAADRPHRSLLVAEHQRAGRGRLDRTWVTPARAALTLSLLLRPSASRERWGWLPLLAGVAVVRTLREVAGVQAGLKWPNDVLLPPRPGTDDGAGKVAGLLAQVEGDAVVLGVGLNVTSTAQELPPGGTSLRLAGAATTDRDTVLRALVRELVRQVDGWDAAGGDAGACGLAGAARELCVTLGQAVRVERPDGDLLGDAEGLDDDGRLLVRQRSGALTAVAAGDVVHLRGLA
jgi:BirA family biotin operon repressor/biotin-[acetyl-CoA-carboxylase] ligase